MALKSTNPTRTLNWKNLFEHYEEIKDVHMLDLFDNDPHRAENLRIRWEDFYVDYSKNRITDETLNLLIKLANDCDLSDAISRYFGGEFINQTENRAVLHTALRASDDLSVMINGKDVITEVKKTKHKIKTFCDSVINGNFTGYTGKKFTHIVNIGIGGSDLGPAMVVDALRFYRNHLKVSFVSNVDGDHMNEVIKTLDPETTLFVIVSKSFTTQETLTNANSIRNWFLEFANEDAIKQHFVAVSTNLEKVEEFGIASQNIFPMWDWVGGRFSLWSAVGLSIALTLGYENFERLLSGAGKMDAHFKEAPFEKNIPVVLALISIWYNNFFKAESEAIIPYTQYLNQFATYLQQAVMESNGKSVDRSGERINYQTGNIIWGEPGTNSQHAFFQLIHQGTKLIPADFIGFARSLHGNQEHQDKLMANFFAQTEALLKGKTKEEVVKEMAEKGKDDQEIASLMAFREFEGNKPTNTIFIEKLSPESLGKLIALYEHKIFVQGVIWNIFSYDQFGVELGKELAGKILNEFDKIEIENHDASTKNLIEFYKQLR